MLITFVVALLCGGCYSYFAYRYSPERLEIRNWRVELSSRLQGDVDEKRTTSRTTTTDSLGATWRVFVQSRVQNEPEPLTSLVVDSIFIIAGDTAAPIVQRDPLWQRINPPKHSYRSQYMFGLFDIPDPVTSDVTVGLYVRIVDLATDSTLEASLFELTGRLQKVRKVWVGN